MLKLCASISLLSSALGAQFEDRPTAGLPQFGRSHCIVADVDGDGVEDVLVAEPGERLAAGTDEPAGAVYLLSGATGKALRRFGPGEGDRVFGDALASVPLFLRERFGDAVALSSIEGDDAAIRLTFLDLRAEESTKKGISLPVEGRRGGSRISFLPEGSDVGADLLIRHGQWTSAELLLVSLETGTIVRRIGVEEEGFLFAETMEIVEEQTPGEGPLLVCGSPATSDTKLMGRIEIIRLRDGHVLHRIASKELGPHFGGVLARIADDDGLSFLSSTLRRAILDNHPVQGTALHRVRLPREGGEWQVDPISLQGMDERDRLHVGTHVTAILNAAHVTEEPPILVVACPDQIFSAYIFGFRTDTFEKVWATSGEPVTGLQNDYHFGNVLSTRAFAGPEGEACFLGGTVDYVSGHAPWLFAVRARDGEVMWKENIHTVKAALRKE